MKSKNTYHHGDLRNALLQAGERLLAKEGVVGLSLRKVAQEAGVSHSAHSRHFRDKRALLSAIAQAGFERLAEAMDKAEKQHPDDPAKQLRAAGIGYVTLAVDNPETANLMFGGAIKPDEKDAELMEAGDKAFQGLVQIIENGQQAGIYKERKTMELALTAWSSSHGLALLITAGKLKDTASSEDQVTQLAASVCEILERGMLK